MLFSVSIQLEALISIPDRCAILDCLYPYGRRLKTYATGFQVAFDLRSVRHCQSPLSVTSAHRISSFEAGPPDRVTGLNLTEHDALSSLVYGRRQSKVDHFEAKSDVPPRLPSSC